MQTNNTDTALEAQLNRLMESARVRTETLLAFLATQPQTVRCEKHAAARRISFELSAVPYFAEKRAAYEPCALCVNEEKQRERERRFIAMGIPPLLVRACLDELEY